MRHDLTVSKSVLINAPAAKVWEVLTRPELIKEYLYGTDTLTDWKVGSDIVFQGEYNGQQYRDHGKILSFTPHEGLSYSYWSGFSGIEDKPENYSVITYTLEPEGPDQTRFTWSQKGFASEQGYQHSEASTGMLLDQIKNIAER